YFFTSPKRLREQVRRNRERFPDDFMFELTVEEAEMVVPQNAAPSPRSLLGGHLPFVFTQEGIAMLSGVLRSPRAVRANIEIMRAFVYAKTRERWRGAALTKLEELERRFLGHDRDIARLFEALRDLMDPPEKPRRKIGFQTD
ncbi:MAG TPA: DNA-binding protein, partial [Elusimicrobia bacterium]|nr:DNA-binding protein [Elusimicrobiota bacterium]